MHICDSIPYEGGKPVNLFGHIFHLCFDPRGPGVRMSGGKGCQRGVCRTGFLNPYSVCIEINIEITTNCTGTETQ